MFLHVLPLIFYSDSWINIYIYIYIYIWWPNPSVCPSRKSNSDEVFHLDRVVTFDPRVQLRPLFSSPWHGGSCCTLVTMSAGPSAPPPLFSLVLFAVCNVGDASHTSLTGWTQIRTQTVFIVVSRFKHRSLQQTVTLGHHYLNNTNYYFLECTPIGCIGFFQS